MGLDLDLQDGGIRGAADGSEGAAAAPAPARRARDVPVLDNGGQVRVVAAAWPLLAALLAAGPARWVVGAGGGRGSSGAGLGLAAEELLLAEAQLGAELFDLLLEEGLALDGTVLQGLPVASLAPGLELLGQAWADGPASRMRTADSWRRSNCRGRFFLAVLLRSSRHLNRGGRKAGP